MPDVHPDVVELFTKTPPSSYAVFGMRVAEIESGAPWWCFRSGQNLPGFNLASLLVRGWQDSWMPWLA